MDHDVPVGATATTARVVEALVERGEAGVTELATDLDLSKGAVHNHLSTLVELGFAVREDGRYAPSMRFLDLGTRIRAGRPAYAAAREELAALARASGEAASLVVPERDRAVYAHVVGSETTDLDLRTGQHVPLHACAAGKAILAHRPESETRGLVDRVGLTAATETTHTDEADFFAELQTVRDQGLAFAREEQAQGVSSVAAPVTTENGHAVGALAVSGPADRLTGKRLEEDITGLVVSSAKAVSVGLYSE